MHEQLLEAWRIHARIGVYVLDALDPAALQPASGFSGRSVGEQFAHIHNVRLMWLKAAASDLLQGLAKVERTDAGDRDVLRRSLQASAAATEALLARGLERGSIKGFKPHPPAFLAYLVAHESYHQGDIGIRLAAAGHPLDKRTEYGIWEWGSR